MVFVGAATSVYEDISMLGGRSVHDVHIPGVALNLGLACIFIWVAVFHHYLLPLQKTGWNYDDDVANTKSNR